MNFLLLLVIMSMAQENRLTESQQLCLENAESKHTILNAVIGTCKWKLPVTENAGPAGEGVVGQCSAYTVQYDERQKKNIKVKKKSTYSGSGHSGVLECGSSFNENETSYKAQTPKFVYQCSECSTSDNSDKLDDRCVQSMHEIEKNACRAGSPLMNNRYPLGQSPNDKFGQPLQ